MENDINDLCVELVLALGALERGEPGAAGRHQLLRERLAGIHHEAQASSASRAKPALRLVWSAPAKSPTSVARRVCPQSGDLCLCQEQP